MTDKNLKMTFTGLDENQDKLDGATDGSKEMFSHGYGIPSTQIHKPESETEDEDIPSFFESRIHPIRRQMRKQHPLPISWMVRWNGQTVRPSNDQ